MQSLLGVTITPGIEFLNSPTFLITRTRKSDRNSSFRFFCLALPTCYTLRAWYFYVYLQGRSTRNIIYYLMFDPIQ